MGRVKTLTGAAACVAFLAVHSAGAAHPAAGAAEKPLEADERATDEALLAALLKRRAQVVGATGDNRAALEFLDKRIAGLERRLGR